MKSINNIQKIIMTKRVYSFPDCKCMRSDNVELSLEGIKGYRTLNGSKKHVSPYKVEVEEAEMKAFFSDLYEFVRNATECGYTVDDCERKVRFIYSDYHEEIFWGWTGNEKENLTGKIWEFVNLHF